VERIATTATLWRTDAGHVPASHRRHGACTAPFHYAAFGGSAPLRGKRRAGCLWPSVAIFVVHRAASTHARLLPRACRHPLTRVPNLLVSSRAPAAQVHVHSRPRYITRRSAPCDEAAGCVRCAHRRTRVMQSGRRQPPCALPRCAAPGGALISVLHAARLRAVPGLLDQRCGVCHRRASVCARRRPLRVRRSVLAGCARGGRPCLARFALWLAVPGSLASSRVSHCARGCHHGFVQRTAARGQQEEKVAASSIFLLAAGTESRGRQLKEKVPPSPFQNPRAAATLRAC